MKTPALNTLGVIIGLVVCPWLVSAQQIGEAGSAVVKRFDTYRNSQLQEKIFVHADRGFYLAGETIWLKLYCVDGAYHRPLTVSQVAYVEVLDDHQRSILQGKIDLAEDGRGNGTLSLPVSISSGHYLIRAYTQWMKNFSSDFYFQQLITVVNPFIRLPETIATPSTEFDVQFFPEGGNLVNGLNQVIAFKGVDKNGRGIDFNGALIDENNDTLTRFKPLRFGMGSFTFTPQRGHSYKAVVRNQNQKNHSFKLPDAYNDGMVMHLTDSPDRIKIAIDFTENSATQNRIVYLLGHTRNNVVVYDARMLSGRRVEFAVDKNRLGEGITHFTLFTEQGVPACERLYFKKPSQILDVATYLEAAAYNPRKKVALEITTRLDVGNPVPANLSISVYKQDALDQPGTDIRNYLLLTSDLKGTIESPSFYFEAVDSGEAVDNLMLTQGWTRFKWEEVLHSVQNLIGVPEHNGHIIAARITNKGVPVSGIQVFLTASGLYTRPYIARSNNKGELFFEMQHFYGSNEIVVQTDWRQDSVYRLEILNPFAQTNGKTIFPELTLNETLRQAAEQRSIYMQVQNIFHKSERARFLKPKFDSLSFYGPPDHKYELDDYTRFPTMEEVMREYVRDLQVRKHRDGFHFMSFDLVNRTYFNEDPFIMLDGIPIFNINSLMAFDPKLVKSVESMNRKFYLGSYSFHGILSYRTYRGDLGGYQPDARSLIVSYDGLQLQREFYSPKYESQIDTTVPDTRTLLYWSPNITTGKDGKAHVEFYTSDVSGKYKVVVQGITNEGQPGYGEKAFEVEKANGL